MKRTNLSEFIFEPLTPFNFYLDPRATHLERRWWHRFMFWKRFVYQDPFIKTETITLKEAVSKYETNNNP